MEAAGKSYGSLGLKDLLINAEAWVIAHLGPMNGGIFACLFRDCWWTMSSPKCECSYCTVVYNIYTYVLPAHRIMCNCIYISMCIYICTTNIWLCICKDISADLHVLFRLYIYILVYIYIIHIYIWSYDSGLIMA